MNIRLLIVCCSMVIVGSSIVFAQTATEPTIQKSLNNSLRITPAQIKKALAVQHSIQEVVREKTRFTKEDILKALQQTQQKGSETSNPNDKKSLSSDRILSGSEKIVSADPSAESELHAAINPTDSSNMIVSPIKSPQNPLDGLLCPIYYTKDFGKTWKKSSFQTKPKNAAALTIGGGDPMFAFDAAGKLYMSWINLYIVNFSFDTVLVNTMKYSQQVVMPFLSGPMPEITTET